MKFLFTILAFATFLLNNYAQVIRVPQDYAGIQTAIDSAKVGDTILVAAGTYECSKINKSLMIKGENKNSVVFTKNLEISNTSFVYMDNIKFDINFYDAVTINNSNNIYLSNMDLVGAKYMQDRSVISWATGFGLEINNSDSIFITNTEMKGSSGFQRSSSGGFSSQDAGSPAVHISSSSNIFIDNCTIVGGYGLSSYGHGYGTPGEYAKSIEVLNSSAVAISNTHLLSPAFNDSTSTIAYNNVIGVKNKEEDENIPASFSLNQNYPNPFNPATIISYDLPNEGFITLKIYDILGREIAILVNEIQRAGTYKVSFNGDMLSSGVYIYRLQIDNKVFSKKMILQK